MDPKVCGKLLTIHRRGYGVDVEALHGRFPLWQRAGEGQRRDPVDTKGCGGGNRVSWCSWMFSGYMDIYWRRKSVRAATRGPQGWWARPPPLGAPLSPGPHERPPTYFFLLYIPTYPETSREPTKNNFHRRNLLYPRDPILEPSSALYRRGNQPRRASNQHPFPSDEL